MNESVENESTVITRRLYGYTFRGSNSCHLHNCFPLFQLGDQLSKERICSLNEQIPSFKSRSLFGKVLLARKINRKSQKLYFFVKISEKQGGL